MKASQQELERADTFLHSTGVDHGFETSLVPDVRLLLVCSQRALARQPLGRRHAAELTAEGSQNTVAVLGEKSLVGVRKQTIFDYSDVTRKLISDFMWRKDA